MLSALAISVKENSHSFCSQESANGQKTPAFSLATVTKTNLLWPEGSLSNTSSKEKTNWAIPLMKKTKKNNAAEREKPHTGTVTTKKTWRSVYEVANQHHITRDRLQSSRLGGTRLYRSTN
jgi:hypothetical protein